MTTNQKNTITGFRNLLGRTFSDPVTQDEIRNVPFTVEEQKNKTAGFKVNYLGNEEVLPIQQVTVAMLSHLKAIAETALKMKVTDCVISVPAYFTDSQRRALLDSCQAIQLNCLQLINDTTAAALAYGKYVEDLPKEREKSRNVVFVDLGYTGLQVAVCAFNEGKLKVIAKSFQLGVGGRYFDECLVNHFAEEFKKKYKIDGLAKPRHRLRLIKECEKLKKCLSAANANTKITINIESFVDDKDVTAHMNREELQQLCSGLTEKIQATLADVLGKARLTVEDIYSVEIIGGSCHIPAVKEVITKVFKKPPSTMLNMDEAIAKGCALQCAILSPTFRVRDFSITDIQPFPIKLSWESKFSEEILQGEDQLPSSDMIVFKEGDHIGVSKMLTFYRKEPFFLQAVYADPLTVPCENHVIGRFSVKNVVPAATGEPSKVKVKIRVNTHGIFGVMNTYIVEKTIVEEPPPPAVDTVAGEPKKPNLKKQVKHIDLPVESVTFSLSKVDLNALMEKEGEMHAQDKKQL